MIVTGRFYQVNHKNDSLIDIEFNYSEKTNEQLSIEKIKCWLSILIHRFCNRRSLGIEKGKNFNLRKGYKIFVDFVANNKTQTFKLKTVSSDTILENVIVCFPLKDSTSKYYISSTINTLLKRNQKALNISAYDFNAEKIFNSVEYNSLKKGENYGPIVFHRNSPKN